MNDSCMIFSFINLEWTIEKLTYVCHGTIASKINDTPKGVYLHISKLHSILVIVNLLAHNNKFVTAVKFHYRVLQLTVVFLII